MTEIDAVALAVLACDIAREAGELLSAGRADARTTARSKSSPTDHVTSMDLRSEALIARRLHHHRPGDGIVAEEGTDRSSGTGVVWVVDPLDGTTNYLYGYPGWNVSVAATIDGVAIAGAVVDPSRGETFHAALGHGAFLDGHRLSMDPAPDLDRALVATGFGYSPDLRRNQADVVRRIIGDLRDIRRGGAAAVDLCWVAAGRVDAYYEVGLAPWDHAAGGLVAAEAGADVLGPPGEAPSADLVVAAAAPLSGGLRDLVVAAQRAVDGGRPQ